MNNRLFVGNLPFSADEDELRNTFSQFGEVTDAKLITDRETGRSRGFGFVTLDTDENAAAAIEAMDGASMGGRDIRVNVAEQRRDRGGGGGGGGGRGGGGRRGGGRDGGREDRW